jgi:flagellar operon protein
MSSGPFLYPNVTSVPSTGTQVQDKEQKKVDKAEFDQVFEKALKVPEDLSQVRSPLKFSAHASQRLQDRKIALDTQTMAKVNDAIDKAAAKGVEESLVLTDKAALIVSVKNRTVITALDRQSMSGNVFTNIDGAVIV